MTAIGRRIPQGRAVTTGCRAHAGRANPDASVRDGPVGRRHIQERHGRASQRHRKVVGQRRRDAELADHLKDGLGTDSLRHAHSRHVKRLLQRAAHRHVPAKLPVVVLRRPGPVLRFERDRFIGNHAGRRQIGLLPGSTCFERRKVDEGLDQRAGLAVRLHSPIELTDTVIPSSHQRQNRPRRWFKHRHRPLQKLLGPLQRRIGPLEPCEAVLQCFRRRLLHQRIERAVDAQSLRQWHPDGFLDLFQDRIHKIGGVGQDIVRRRNPHRLIDGNLPFCFCQMASIAQQT